MKKPFWTEAAKKPQRPSKPPRSAGPGAEPATPRFGPKKRQAQPSTNLPDPSAPVRLNRFISQAGVCSRRDADELIQKGLVKVNGEVVTELGKKVLPRKDVVEYNGKRLDAKRYVYVLLNKPKNMITTREDPMGRRTVLDPIEQATRERVNPVGRLDRNTTGLLLLTNDGDLAQKLTHPSKRIRKIYAVRTDRPVAETHLQRLVSGVELEDGVAKADKADYITGGQPNEIGIELHIGRNRVVRRMMEALGYEVMALDRVMLGPLTKKNLPRGKWRLLTDEEVAFLKML